MLSYLCSRYSQYLDNILTIKCRNNVIYIYLHIIINMLVIKNLYDMLHEIYSALSGPSTAILAWGFRFLLLLEDGNARLGSGSKRASPLEPRPKKT